MKKLITQDVYDIVKQIKQIDKNYFVMYDEEKKKYELHDQRYKPTFSITLYDKLDKRSVKKVFNSQSKNAVEIFKAIDKTNDNIEKYSTELIIDKVKCNIKEKLNNKKYL